MTNKTITLDRAVAERLRSAIQHGDLFRPDDLEALRAALADPVPPASGEPEVLGWVVTDMNGDFYFAANRQTPDDTALIDRAHVTRLQAEVSKWQSMAQDQKSLLDVVGRRADRLQAEVEECRVENETLKAQADEQAYTLTGVRAQRDALQSELTKARELLESVVAGTGTSPAENRRYGKIREFLSNQSAPADKDDPALIKTLRANGDRIAMEATIAQQAQRIADLEACQGQGEPVTYSSTQATNCAGCGKCKHTPLRVDGMGGYVCLTCIDERLEGLLDAEQDDPVAVVLHKDWQGNLLDEMDARFGLHKHDDCYLPNDDTQIGVEFAIEWIASNLVPIHD